MIGQRHLTREQNTFLDLLSNIGCMSDYQARHILREYLGIKGTSVGGTLQALSRQQLIRYSLDGKFITMGGFSIKESVDRNIVEDISVMMHVYDTCIENDENGILDVQGNIGFIFRPRSEFEMEFISNSVIYHIMHIPSDQLFKMKVIEKKAIDAEKKINSAYSVKDNGSSMTLFVFSGGVNEDRVLEKIGDLGELEITHRLVFMKGREIEGKIGFNIYES